jgi:CheY-like chemotaxis protein
VAMPGTDGFDLIRQVRQLSEEDGGQTPVIALTALSSADDRRRIIRAGFTMHVPKPIDPSELLVVLAAVVGKRRSRT